MCAFTFVTELVELDFFAFSEVIVGLVPLVTAATPTQQGVK